jgi:hypothetical protein
MPAKIMAVTEEVKPKKLTLQIERELDFLLYSIAIQRGMTKAELALKYLRDGVERSGAKAKLKAAYAMLTGEDEAAA